MRFNQNIVKSIFLDCFHSNYDKAVKAVADNVETLCKITDYSKDDAIIDLCNQVAKYCGTWLESGWLIDMAYKEMARREMVSEISRKW